MQVFHLEHCNWDSSHSYYLIAPPDATQESFQNLCDSLLLDAAKEACRLRGNTLFPTEKDTSIPCFIGWNSLVDVLAQILLPKHGYRVIYLPKVEYVGGGIINKYKDRDDKKLPPEARAIIIAHNEEIDK